MLLINTEIADVNGNFKFKSPKGPPRGFGDLGRRAIYFQGAGEHC